MQKSDVECYINSLVLFFCLFSYPACYAALSDLPEKEPPPINFIGILSDPEKRVFLLISEDTKLPLNIQCKYWWSNSSGNTSQIYTQTTQALSHVHSFVLKNQEENEKICLQFFTNLQEKKCVVLGQTEFIEFPAPQKVSMKYVDYKHEVTWTYKSSYLNLSSPDAIAFEVEYYDLFSKWTPVSDCQLVSKLRCVLEEKKPVIPVGTCPEESDAGEKRFRVKPCMMQHPRACGEWVEARPVTIGEEELPKPTNVQVKSINFNHSITWEYNNSFPLEFFPGNVTFSVEYYVDLGSVWIPVPECQLIHDLYCDLFCSYYDPSYEKECPDYSMKGTIQARVKACVNSGLNGCGESVESNSIYLPDDGIIAPPDFSIIGLFGDHELRVLNKPHMVSFTNKTLSCYYNDALLYEIRYYGKNDDVLSRQDIKDVTFDMDVIYLKLKHKPKNHTLMCVKMRLYDDVKTIFSDWREICDYLYVNQTNLESDLPDSNKTAIYIVVGLFVVLVLIVLYIGGRNLKRCIQSAYIEDKKIPKELEETMQRLNEDQDGHDQPDYVVMNSRRDVLGTMDSFPEVIHPLASCPSFTAQSQAQPALDLNLNSEDIRIGNDFLEENFHSSAVSLNESSFTAAICEEDSMKYVQEATPNYTFTNTICNANLNERNSFPSNSRLENEVCNAMAPQTEDQTSKGIQQRIAAAERLDVKVITKPKIKLIKTPRTDIYNLHQKSKQKHPNVKRWDSTSESHSMSHLPLAQETSFKKNTVIYTTPVHTFSESQEDISNYSTAYSSRCTDFEQSLKDRLSTSLNGINTRNSFECSKNEKRSADDTILLHVREMENPTYNSVSHNRFCDDGSFSNIYEASQIDKRVKEEGETDQKQCYLSMGPLNQNLSSYMDAWKQKNATDGRVVCNQPIELNNRKSEKPSTLMLDSAGLPKTNRASAYHKRVTKRQRDQRGANQGVSSVFNNFRNARRSRSCRNNAKQSSVQSQSGLSFVENCSQVNHAASTTFGSSQRSRTDSCRSEDSGLPHDWPSISDESPSPQCSPRDLMLQQTQFCFQDEQPNSKYAMDSFIAHPESTSLCTEQIPRHLAHSTVLPEITESPVNGKEKIKSLETSESEDETFLLSNNIAVAIAHLDNDSYVKLASLSQCGAK